MSERWDQRYRSGEYGEKEPDALVVQTARFASRGRALDVACGLGRHAVWLAENGWDVTAVDYSEVALDRLRERAAGLSVEVVRADLEAGQFRILPETYDLICDSCFLWRPLIGPMRDGLKLGGVFVGIFRTVPRSMHTGYVIEPAEPLGFFHDWEILHYEAGPVRSEIIAKRPAAP